MSFHRSYFAYIDGLLNELENSGVGCYMGGVFAGAFAYADDITILSPSVLALKYMVDIYAIIMLPGMMTSYLS